MSDHEARLIVSGSELEIVWYEGGEVVIRRVPEGTTIDVPGVGRVGPTDHPPAETGTPLCTVVVQAGP